MKRRFLQASAVVGMVLLVPVPTALAFTTNTWTNTLGGTWETSANWSQSSVPDFDNLVRFTNAGTYTVTVGNIAADTVPNSFTNTQIDIGGVTGSPTLTFNYTNAIDFVLTTNSSTATPLRIGDGTVNWDAPNAVLTMSRMLSMNPAGFGSNATLNIFSGRVNADQPNIGISPGSMSVINILTGGVLAFTDSNTRFGYSNGVGQVNISGGTMIWSNTAFLGINQSSTGRILMTSGLLQVPNGSLQLGSGEAQSAQRGYGQVIVSNGNVDARGPIRVGAGPRANGEFFLFGGTVTNVSNGDVLIGSGRSTSLTDKGFATGTVVIAGGTWVHNSAAWLLGAETGSVGVVHLSNGVLQVGTSSTARRIDVGQAVSTVGDFNVAGGTMLLNTNSYMALGVGSNSVGTLRVTSGTLAANAGTPTNSASIIVGSNDFATGRMILEGGVVQLKTIHVGASGILSNRTGGVLQFLGVDHVLGTGSKIVDGGTLSYRNYSALTVSVAAAKFNIVSGSGLQLDSSTNANIAGAYTLTDAANSFKELSLTGTNPKWNSDSLEIASSSRLHVTNATGARVAGTVTNSGIVFAQNSTVTFEKPLLNAGRYISDPSTNTFNDNTTVTASGTLEGGTGDRFDFKKNLFLESTNRVGFNLLSSTVSFSGGINHTNTITGVDVGTNGLGHIHNFLYGELTLGSASDHIYFGSGDGAASNALYVFFLDMPGGSDAARLSVATNNLHTLTDDINIYYAGSNIVAANAYLQDMTYLLPGGGFLIPASIPEPSALTLLMLAASGMLLRRSKRA